jgi:hypothetical protein
MRKMENNAIRRALVFCAVLSVCGAQDVYTGIESTVHNLSKTGPGPIKAVSETQICVFCHTPHSAVVAPLWNHSLSSAFYAVPSNAMNDWIHLKSSPQNPPDGDSRLCLSCHDGTVAVGSVVNLGGSATIVSMQDSGTLRLTGDKLASGIPSNFGTDLSGHHPVSIEVNAALLKDKDAQCNNNEITLRVCNPPPPLKLRPTANLYVTGPHTNLGIQCSSCHDAHNDPVPGTTKFLRVQSESELPNFCATCHPPCSQGCP